MEKVIVAWSSGKDSVMALYETQISKKYEISGLLTIITEDYNRISMHGVRNSLLEKQAKSVGLPLHKIFVSKNGSNEEYAAKMEKEMIQLQKQGVSGVVFGDIFLEDVKKYREKNLQKIGMNGLFPLWKRKTIQLAKTSINLGFKAVVTCVDSKVLGKSFVGRIIDDIFLDELPQNVDPCGENGEYHSFVFDGPIFQERIKYTIGNKVLKDQLYYCDLFEL